jgi:hypothetical protein
LPDLHLLCHPAKQQGMQCCGRIFHLETMGTDVMLLMGKKVAGFALALFCHQAKEQGMQCCGSLVVCHYALRLAGFC